MIKEREINGSEVKGSSEDSYRLQEEFLPVNDGTITLRCITPVQSASNQTYPLLVWYHGGGIHTP